MPIALPPAAVIEPTSSSVDAAGRRPFRRSWRGFVGDAQAIDEGALHPSGASICPICGPRHAPPPVDADCFQRHDILGKIRGAASGSPIAWPRFPPRKCAGITLEIGQRLDQHFGFDTSSASARVVGGCSVTGGRIPCAQRAVAGRPSGSVAECKAGRAPRSNGELGFTVGR